MISMPLKVIADYRELLIDIFFAIIITIGFEKFLYGFFLDNIFRINSFNIVSLIDIFSEPNVVFNTLFFFATYFWIISHWVFYHELIKKYPYYNYSKFFIDIALFSILFVIINISYSAYNGAITYLFISLLGIWYSFACLWHLSDIALRPIGRYVTPHLKRVLAYCIFLALLYDPLSLGEVTPWYRYCIILSVIATMISWNIHRLSKFVKRDIREYNCNYVSGYPGWSSQINRGILILEKYPIRQEFGNRKQKPKRKVEDNKEDRIEFKVGKNPGRISILPKKIINLSIITQETEVSENDRMIQIDFKDDFDKIINLVIDLNDETIEGVEEGIKEIWKRNEKIEYKVRLQRNTFHKA